MNGLRFFVLSIAAVVIVALACVPIISAQEGAEKTADRSTCKIYSLADLGNDSELCKWIADTIPKMIEPESWQERWGTSTLPTPSNGKKNALSYYAPAKVMVVHHTPAVHAQIDEFLQNLKKAMPTQKAANHARPASDAQVLQAQYYPPVASQSQGTYPVPMQPKQPKHLFHFIIRYEGEGIIDQNVVRFTKAMTDAAKAEANSGNVAPPPAASSSYSVGPSAPPAFGGPPMTPPTVLPSPSYAAPAPSAPPPPLPF